MLVQAPRILNTSILQPGLNLVFLVAACERVHLGGCGLLRFDVCFQVADRGYLFIRHTYAFELCCGAGPARYS